jgi:diketogulonate reductase-like aldo/keto reductase
MKGNIALLHCRQRQRVALDVTAALFHNCIKFQTGAQLKNVLIFPQLPHVGNRASDVGKYLTISLRRLQLDYVDLYLVHVPFGFVPDKTSDNPAKNADGSYILDDTDLLAVWKVISHIIL